MHDVYVFGDSHWRVFFPFVNHGAASDNVSHEQDGIRTIDTIANELSGSTMWGLLNQDSRHGARRRILGTIDSLGGVDNVGLVFGEVDARYHNARYFPTGSDRISLGRVMELVGRYRRFIEEDLLTGRVRGRVFVYHGFGYPKGPDTLLQPGEPIGERVRHAELVNDVVGDTIESMIDRYLSNVEIIRWTEVRDLVSNDGVHLIPDKIYPYVLNRMKRSFEPPRSPRELSL